MQFTFCPDKVCTFHHVQLGNGLNGTKTLRQFMADINHTNAQIDILKIDIEYSEHLFFHTLFSNDALNRSSPPVYIRQILLVSAFEGFCREEETNPDRFDRWLLLFRKCIWSVTDCTKLILSSTCSILKTTSSTIENWTEVFHFLLVSTACWNWIKDSSKDVPDNCNLNYPVISRSVLMCFF